MEDERTALANVATDDEEDIERLIDWAERLGPRQDARHRPDPGAVDSRNGYCKSDLEDDAVGLPSGVINPESEMKDRRLLEDKEEIECGCTVDEKCRECVEAELREQS
jgi:hypothetical protein